MNTYIVYITAEIDCFSAVQVEWAKTFARVNRYKEELELVLEEMKRVQRYFIFRQAWWLERGESGLHDVLPKIKFGRLAYAHKQADIADKLREKFVKFWISKFNALGVQENAICI